ncbi:MAG: FHA domain-containing protein, partial [Hyphomonas sp.]
PPLADSECVPAARRAEEASDRAEEVESEKEQVRQELDSARDELEKAKEQAKEAAEKAEEAQKEADRLEQKAEELRNDADATEVERKEAEEAATRAADIAKNTAQQAAAAADLISDLEARIERLEAALKGANTMLIAGAVAFVLLGGLALIFLLRRGSALRKASESRDRAEAELARRFADIECRGRDPEGHPHAFKISGDALVKNPEGLIVGRQPSSSAIVFNHPEVSRTHVRVKLEEDRVFVEDLDSTNGTKINGESLVPGEPRELKDGDELALGAIVMGVKFHDV